MVTKILFETWDVEMRKRESEASFDTVEAFLAAARKFKNRTDEVALRVHIPAGFQLSSAEKKQIDELNIRGF
jgi:hypothetical protein